jgi:magnesium-transporting ATPase (P-type)
LNGLNISQAREENLSNLQSLGGLNGLANRLNISLEKGLTEEQVHKMGSVFGFNAFPQAPPKYFIVMLFGALSDPTLLVLLAAATVSLVLGIFEDPQQGWIEAVAIFIAVALVSMITTTNDYSKELQFRALEKSSQQDERTTVLRGGAVQRVLSSQIVVGDIVMLQAGDMIPADCILVDKSAPKVNESSLTGEADDLKKTHDHDPFLLSSCLITESQSDVHALVTGIGLHSQWGKIKSSLDVEAVDTPLQEKLQGMTNLVSCFV